MASGQVLHAQEAGAPTSVETHRKQREEINAPWRDLAGQLNARRAELEKNDAVVALRETFQKADQVWDETVKTDAKLTELRKAEEAAGSVIEPVRNKVAKADAEATAPKTK